MFARLRSLWRSLWKRSEQEHDLDDEIHFHIEARTQDLIRNGLSRAEALRCARLEFGALDKSKEACRESTRVNWLEDLLQDVRFALRILRKSPGFTAVAVLTLALGIGANTAIFSVLEGVVLAPLPYSDPDRLVVAGESNPRFPLVWVSYPNFLDRQRIARSFQQMAAITWRGYDLTSLGVPERIDGGEISSGFFSTLGAELALGRDFSPKEDQQGGAPAVIISNRLWRNHFDSSPQVLGMSLTLDGVDYQIVGVTPQGFQFEDDADVYTPLRQGDPAALKVRGSHLPPLVRPSIHSFSHFLPLALCGTFIVGAFSG